jgi:hypothetical protein
MGGLTTISSQPINRSQSPLRRGEARPHPPISGACYIPQLWYTLFMQCLYCGKPMTLDARLPGNPQVSHGDCAYRAMVQTRERLRQLKEARYLPQPVVSGIVRVCGK